MIAEQPTRRGSSSDVDNARHLAPPDGIPSTTAVPYD